MDRLIWQGHHRGQLYRLRLCKKGDVHLMQVEQSVPGQGVAPDGWRRVHRGRARAVSQTALYDLAIAHANADGAPVGPFGEPLPEETTDADV